MGNNQNKETGKKRVKKEFTEDLPKFTEKGNIQNNNISSINNNPLPNLPNLPTNDKPQDKQDIEGNSELDEVFK